MKKTMLSIGTLALVVVAITGVEAFGARDVAAPAAPPQNEGLAFSAADGGAAPEFMFQVQPVRPKPRGMSCDYTCSSGGSTWHLVCNENSQEECCGIANAVCPYLETGSTGTASCSCS